MRSNFCWSWGWGAVQLLLFIVVEGEEGGQAHRSWCERGKIPGDQHVDKRYIKRIFIFSSAVYIILVEKKLLFKTESTLFPSEKQKREPMAERQHLDCSCAILDSIGCRPRTTCILESSNRVSRMMAEATWSTGIEDWISGGYPQIPYPAFWINLSCSYFSNMWLSPCTVHSSLLYNLKFVLI